MAGPVGERADLVVLNHAAFFATQQRGLLRDYLPPLNLMSLVAYLRAELPTARLQVIDPEVHYVEPREVAAVLDPIVGRRKLGQTPDRVSVLRRANNAMFAFMADQEPRVAARLRADLEAANPQVIAVPFHYSGSYAQSAALTALARRAAPRALLVTGGAHATCESAALLAEQPGLDVVIVGEAERPLRAILQAALQGRLRTALRQIPGLVHRAGGEVHDNGPGRRIEDLDAIPHPYTVADDFALDRRRELFFLMPWLQANFASAEQEDPAGVFLTSRGCPFDCSFCANAASSGRHVRFHSVDYVRDMVRHCVERYALRSANIADALFGLNRSRTLALCESLAPVGLTWHCQSRADVLCDDVLGAFARLGMGSVAVGAETFNHRALALSGKGLDPDRLRGVARRLRHHGIKPVGTFIVGLPGDDAGSVLRTAALAREVGFEEVSFFPAQAVVGSRLYRLLVDQVPRRRWRASGLDPKDVLYTAEMSKPQLLWLAQKAQAVFEGRERDLRWSAWLRQHGAYLVYDRLPHPWAMGVDRCLRRANLI